MRTALNRLLRGCMPQPGPPTPVHEADAGPVLAFLRVGVSAGEIIGRFAEPIIRVQVRNWTVVISLSHEGRYYSAAVDDGRVVGLRCRYAGGAPDAAALSAEAARFLPLDGEEIQRVIFRQLPDGWLLALRQGGAGLGEALDVELSPEPARGRDRLFGS